MTKWRRKVHGGSRGFCHSGSGLTCRVQAEFLGASHALRWYTGSSVQPALLKVLISDQNCLKCHQAVTQKGFTPKEQITMPGNGSRGGDSGGRNNPVSYTHLTLQTNREV